jgi:hypothetical protein
MNDRSTEKEKATEQRRDAGLTRMLKTPPKPHKDMKKGAGHGKRMTQVSANTPCLRQKASGCSGAERIALYHVISFHFPMKGKRPDLSGNANRHYMDIDGQRPDASGFCLGRG